MNSLLQKEGMAGEVQMIYIDPPSRIKYVSNFQPFTNKSDVKDHSDADLIQSLERGLSRQNPGFHPTRCACVRQTRVCGGARCRQFQPRQG